MLPSPVFTDTTEISLFPSNNAATEERTAIKQEYHLSPPQPPSIADLPETPLALRFSVGPHPQVAVNSVSCCDVSHENILALGTNAVLRPTVKREKTANHAADGWLRNWHVSSNGRKKRRLLTDDVEWEENGDSDGAAASVPVSTLYICDLDRPWRLFPVFTVPGDIVLIKFSPSGNRLVVCNSVGVYFLLTAGGPGGSGGPGGEGGTLNVWHLLHKGRCPTGHTFIYAAWTKTLQTFLYNPTQQSDGFFNMPGRPKIQAVQDNRLHSELDGFFVVTNWGLLTVVYIQPKRINERKNNETKREEKKSDFSQFVFPTFCGRVEGEADFVVADSVFDVDENLFYLALASSATPDVLCVKFPLPHPHSVDGRGQIVPSKTVVFENSTSLMGKNIFQKLKLIISSKVKYLLAATKSFESDYIELWELSTDLQRDFLESLSDPAIVPSEKPAWSMIINQALSAVLVTWSLPSDRFITNDINRSFTVSVAVRNGEMCFYTVKLGLEISITEVGKMAVPHPAQYIHEHTRSVKKIAVTVEASSLVTSANGCMVFMIDTGCRLWAFSLPHTLWLVNHIPDLVEVLLTVHLDFCDVIAATGDAAATLRVLEDVYHGFSLQQKNKSQNRFAKVKTALTEKTEGRLAAVVMASSFHLDVYLVFLEQFVDLKNPEEPAASSALLFEHPAVQMALRNEEGTLESVSVEVQRHIVVEEAVLRSLLTSFHFVVNEVVELFHLFLLHPNLTVSRDNGLTASPTTESLSKIRLVFVLIHIWTSSRPTLRQFSQRPSFTSDHQRTLLEVLFDATGKMKNADWVEVVGGMLEEAGLRTKNWSRDWKRLYEQAEPRAAYLPTSSALNRQEHVEYVWTYNFLPSHGEEGEDGGEIKATGEPDVETFGLRPVKRKYCSRCFFNFPCLSSGKEEPNVGSGSGGGGSSGGNGSNGGSGGSGNGGGTWHSHMRHRWKKCFCGGAWIFL